MTSEPAPPDLCFAHPNVFLVPAECMDEDGISRPMADRLIAPGRLSGRQLQCLEQGLALYWRRVSELFSRAPGSWFPPRQVNLLLVADAAAAPPYLDPFAGTSSMLYVSDLDTNAEFVAFVLVHNGRVAQLRSLRAALICNLSYWLVCEEASLVAFKLGAGRARRPDAAVFTAVADALDWIPSICHDPLRLPPPDTREDSWRVDDADLFVPKRLRTRLMALCADAEASLRQAMTNAARPGPRAGTATLDTLCDWMRRSQAHLIVESPQGDTLWEPGVDDTGVLRLALQIASEDALTSLLQDFRIIHERSRAFLDAVVEPVSLPRHCAVLETGDGAWLDARRQAVVYRLQQPGFDARAVPAPPFHRLLLGARVMHEWGHLAHAGKMLRVPEACQGRYALARAELGRQFMRLVTNVPRRLRADVLHELQTLAPNPHDWPAALARKTLSRVGDYLANLMCSHFLPANEMQAYVRANVRSHLAEGLGFVGELARHAHEVQYLALASMPRSYFFATTHFGPYFIDSGLVSEDDTNALFDAAVRVFACYSIDESRLTLPMSQPNLQPHHDPHFEPPARFVGASAPDTVAATNMPAH